MRERSLVDIAVIKLPMASSLKDFSLLSKEGGVTLKYVEKSGKVGNPRLLIIPGSRDTIRDITFLKESGIADRIRELEKKKKTVILGISGGFQMLGSKIIDIKGSEYRLSKCGGLNFLNIVTRIMPSCVASDVEVLPTKNFDSKIGGPNGCINGFETHSGRTKYLNGSEPIFMIKKRDGKNVEIPDGAMNKKGNVLGTYIHGIFDNENFRKRFLQYLAQ